jgi:predicted HTH transcriptional regulator
MSLDNFGAWSLYLCTKTSLKAILYIENNNVEQAFLAEERRRQDEIQRLEREQQELAAKLEHEKNKDLIAEYKRAQ